MPNTQDSKANSERSPLTNEERERFLNESAERFARLFLEQVLEKNQREQKDKSSKP